MVQEILRTAVLWLSTVAFCALSHSLDAAQLSVTEWQGRTMGSSYTVKIVDAALDESQLRALQDEVDNRLKEINHRMSHYDPESELSRFNRAPANIPFEVSTEFARVVRFSLELNRRSGGAFDPTLSPLINLWGFGERGQAQEVPTEAELRMALGTTGCRHLKVTAQDELVKDIPELTLNLSGVAKGYGVDEMARVLRTHAFTNVYVSIAGEVLALGHNPEGTSWKIGISAPVAHWRETDPMAAVLAIRDRAVSTSGDYQKFFTDAQGRRLCHILNPRTGRPVRHNLAAVTVVAPDCTTADALATTAFVLGPKEGLRFINTSTNAAALFIVRESANQFRPVLSRRFTAMTGYRP